MAASSQMRLRHPAIPGFARENVIAFSVADLAFIFAVGQVLEALTALSSLYVVSDSMGGVIRAPVIVP